MSLAVCWEDKVHLVGTVRNKWVSIIMPDQFLVPNYFLSLTPCFEVFLVFLTESTAILFSSLRLLWARNPWGFALWFPSLISPSSWHPHHLLPVLHSSIWEFNQFSTLMDMVFYFWRNFFLILSCWKWHLLNSWLMEGRSWAQDIFFFKCLA